MKPVQLLIDINLLLLFVVGTADRKYISKHKRLRAYTEEDFDTLLKVVSNADDIVLLPTTLTETSNLARQIADPAQTHILNTLREVINTTEERYASSKKYVKRQEYLRLGLTDASIVEEALDIAETFNTTVFTADLDLYLATVSAGTEALNFNHLREKYL